MFHLIFGDKTKFQKILESVKIDDDLHVQLQYNGMPLLLPQWFIQCHNATLNKVSYLVNFPTYIRNTSTDNSWMKLIKENLPL